MNQKEYKYKAPLPRRTELKIGPPHLTPELLDHTWNDLINALFQSFDEKLHSHLI